MCTVKKWYAKKVLVWLIGLSVFGGITQGQARPPDSLKAAFCRPDAPYDALFGVLTVELNKLDSAEALRQAVALSKKEVADPLYRPYAHLVLAVVRTVKQGDAAGIRALKEMEPLVTASQDRRLKARYYRERGMIQYRNDYDEAYTDLYRAYEYFRDQGKNKQAAFTLYYAGLLLFNSRKKQERAYEMFQEVLQLGKDSLNHRLVINAHVVLGLIDRKEQRLTVAERRYLEAMQVAISQKDSTWIGILSGNLAKLYQDRGEYDQALRNLFLDVRMSKKGKEWGSVTLAYAGIGEIFLDYKPDLPKAKHYLDSALYFAKRRGEERELRVVYRHLASWHEKKGEFAAAYRYKTKELAAADTLLNDVIRDEVAGLEAKYDLQKKEQKLALLAKENQLQDTRLQKQFWTIAAVTVGLTLTVLILLLLYRSNRLRQHKNQLLEEKQAKILNQNEALKQSRDEIEAQRDKLAVKNNALNSQNFKVESSIRAAQTIQQALLPEREELKELLGDYFLLDRPRDVVSGDFYWIKKVDDRLIIVVADCTGHGVPGAFMTLISNNLLDRVVRIQYITEPGSILTRLNQEIFATLRRQESKGHVGMDAVAITLQQRNGQTHIRFAGAKNKLHYVLPDENHLHTLNGDRRSIGGRRAQDTVFREQHISVPDGTMLYLGTDGYADQNNPDLEKFSSARLHELLVNMASEPVAIQHEHLQRALNDFMRDTEQRDDILWLGLRVVAHRLPMVNQY